MNKQPIYTWDPEAHIATSTIYYKNLTFVGTAICHPEDKDMSSKLTGQTIAEMRAIIKCLQFIKNHEIKPQLKAINQLYNSIKNSKRFNPKSYESIMLYRQIHLLENDLATIKQEIANKQQILKEYIEQKEKTYQVIRKFKSNQNKQI